MAGQAIAYPVDVVALLIILIVLNFSLGHIMSSKYIYTTDVSYKFPNSPTRAADIIIGLMNRNATTKIIGMRIPGASTPYALPIDHHVMAIIMGADIAHHYVDSMKNAAIASYLSKVEDKLVQVGMTLFYGQHCWMCVRGANSDGFGMMRGAIYNTADFMSEAPRSHTGA